MLCHKRFLEWHCWEQFILCPSTIGFQPKDKNDWQNVTHTCTCIQYMQIQECCSSKALCVYTACLTVHLHIVGTVDVLQCPCMIGAVALQASDWWPNRLVSGAHTRREQCYNRKCSAKTILKKDAPPLQQQAVNFHAYWMTCHAIGMNISSIPVKAASIHCMGLKEAVWKECKWPWTATVKMASKSEVWFIIPLYDSCLYWNAGQPKFTRLKK